MVTELSGQQVGRLTPDPAGQVAERRAAVDTVMQAGPLDLNTASAEQLRALPGMGEAYVARVIRGRPYTAKNQLLTRGILPQAAYEAIREHIVAHRPARP